MDTVTFVPFGALRARVPRPPVAQYCVNGDTVYEPNMLDGSLGFEVQLRAYLYRGMPGYLPDGYPIPVVPLLHTQIRERIHDGRGELDMSRWHGFGLVCGTTHCWAGWVVHCAGAQGAALEQRTVCSAAARLIMLASCDYLAVETVPDFYGSHAAALATIERYAALEGPTALQSSRTAQEDEETLWPRLAVTIA